MLIFSSNASFHPEKVIFKKAILEIESYKEVKFTLDKKSSQIITSTSSCQDDINFQILDDVN